MGFTGSRLDTTHQYFNMQVALFLFWFRLEAGQSPPTDTDLCRASIYICFKEPKGRQTDTNLERSAAAGPFPLCRTAHASSGPGNYLKRTEGHIRRRTLVLVYQEGGVSAPEL